MGAWNELGAPLPLPPSLSLSPYLGVGEAVTLAGFGGELKGRFVVAVRRVTAGGGALG